RHVRGLLGLVVVALQLLGRRGRDDPPRGEIGLRRRHRPQFGAGVHVGLGDGPQRLRQPGQDAGHHLGPGRQRPVGGLLAAGQRRHVGLGRGRVPQRRLVGGQLIGEAVQCGGVGRRGGDEHRGVGGGGRARPGRRPGGGRGRGGGGRPGRRLRGGRAGGGRRRGGGVARHGEREGRGRRRGARHRRGGRPAAPATAGGRQGHRERNDESPHGGRAYRRARPPPRTLPGRRSLEP